MRDIFPAIEHDRAANPPPWRPTSALPLSSFRSVMSCWHQQCHLTLAIPCNVPSYSPAEASRSACNWYSCKAGWDSLLSRPSPSPDGARKLLCTASAPSPEETSLEAMSPHQPQCHNGLLSDLPRSAPKPTLQPQMSSETLAVGSRWFNFSNALAPGC